MSKPKGSGRGSATSRGRRSRPVVIQRRPVPWGTVAAVLAVLVFAGGVFGYAWIQSADQAAKDEALAQWTPSETNKDPSAQIAGVQRQEYKGGKHVEATQRVAYEQTPPAGGAHDGFWAACNGVVYPKPVRSENFVHSLEHGAVWITYNPEQIKGDQLEKLSARVQGQQYLALSPFPGLDKPVSLQSWGHQLKVDSVEDERIEQFIRSLRRNQYTHPENGASCDTMGAGRFDPDNPPPFDPAPPGPGAVAAREPAEGEQPDPPTTSAGR
ncbi:DUF3105 domain-containing protein [Crossiella sp. CA-258035]|uniref:DUF3105 domain-containing protein n=1 Tax=Crossiella sp. CA-258035 TaxID=2981138 RepID=UPI0024BC75A4|nr:DUF3105 domain-containing protein [Crossiella sp. CA-258035]WHT23373.1 DUF3105 domain-containing protein [Crossiella sp. CA-258035]